MLPPHLNYEHAAVSSRAGDSTVRLVLLDRLRQRERQLACVLD
jgi:hypothetical protein